MKKLIIAFLMLVTSAATYAQFNKGRMLVGGQVSFNYTPDSEYKGSAFSLNPQFGYFVINNLAVGAGLNYNVRKYNFDNSSDYLTTSLQIQPFVRYYFKPGIFVHGSYGIGAGKVNSDDDYSFNLYSWTGSAGYAIFLNDHVAIEPMLGYQWNTLNYKATDSNPSEKNSSSSLYFQVGLQVYLGKRN